MSGEQSDDLSCMQSVAPEGQSEVGCTSPDRLRSPGLEVPPDGPALLELCAAHLPLTELSFRPGRDLGPGAPKRTPFGIISWNLQMVPAVDHQSFLASLNKGAGIFAYSRSLTS